MGVGRKGHGVKRADRTGLTEKVASEHTYEQDRGVNQATPGGRVFLAVEHGLQQAQRPGGGVSGVSEGRGQEIRQRGSRVGEEADHTGPGGHCKDLAFALNELGTKGGFWAEEGHGLICALLDFSGCCVTSTLQRGKEATRGPCEKTIAKILARNESDVPRVVALFQFLQLSNKQPPNSVA